MDIPEFVRVTESIFDSWKQGLISDDQLWLSLPIEPVALARYEKKKVRLQKEKELKLGKENNEQK